MFFPGISSQIDLDIDCYINNICQSSKIDFLDEDFNKFN